MAYTSKISIIPDNDAARLEKLHDYHILDTHSEDTFDMIALMAAQAFDAPAAFITFVDKDRVFIKSNLSQLLLTEAERKASLCSLAILNDSVTVFPDIETIDILHENPYIAIEGGARFFAAAPLKSPEGYNVGAICVVDSHPRQVNDKQLYMLKTLSKIVVDKLENRLRYRKSIEAQINLMNITLHEIQNPLAAINLANDVLKKSDQAKEKMTGMIKSSVKQIQKKLSELLKQSELEETELVLAIEKFELQELFGRLLNNFDLLAKRKQQTIVIDCDDSILIHADKSKISDVLHNLLSNAIKYSYYGSVITITATQNGRHVNIAIQDEGQGLNDDDVNRLFTKFAKLSSKPTGKETSNGLGLSITKSLIEMHNGTIEAHSAGKDKGSTFIVKLPIAYRDVEHPVF